MTLFIQWLGGCGEWRLVAEVPGRIRGDSRFTTAVSRLSAGQASRHQSCEEASGVYSRWFRQGSGHTLCSWNVSENVQYPYTTFIASFGREYSWNLQGWEDASLLPYNIKVKGQREGSVLSTSVSSCFLSAHTLHWSMLILFPLCTYTTLMPSHTVFSSLHLH